MSSYSATPCNQTQDRDELFIIGFQLFIVIEQVVQLMLTHVLILAQVVVPTT